MLIKGVTLPDWLASYKTSNSSKKSISPDCVLAPEAAIRGSGWKTSIDPTGGIIFDVNSFSEPENMEAVIPLVAKMKSLNFKVYLLCSSRGQKYLYEVEEDFKNLPQNVKKLGEFDEKTDYLLCAQKNLARDKVILMDWPKTKELRQSLDSIKQSKDDFQASHLRGAFNLSLPNHPDISCERERKFSVNYSPNLSGKKRKASDEEILETKIDWKHSEEFLKFFEQISSNENSFKLVEEFLLWGKEKYPKLTKNHFSVKLLNHVDEKLKESFLQLIDKPKKGAIAKFLYEDCEYFDDYDDGETDYNDEFSNLIKTALLIKDSNLRKDFIEKFITGEPIETINKLVSLIDESNTTNKIQLELINLLKDFPSAQELLIKKIQKEFLGNTLNPDDISDIFKFLESLEPFPKTKRKLAFKYWNSVEKNLSDNIYHPVLDKFDKIKSDYVDNYLLDYLYKNPQNSFIFLCDFFKKVSPKLLEDYPDIKTKILKIASLTIPEIMTCSINSSLRILEETKEFPEIQKELLDGFFLNSLESWKINDVLKGINCFQNSAQIQEKLIDVLLSKDFQNHDTLTLENIIKAAPNISNSKKAALQNIIDSNCEPLDREAANKLSPNNNLDRETVLHFFKKSLLQARNFPDIQKNLIRNYVNYLDFDDLIRLTKDDFPNLTKELLIENIKSNKIYDSEKIKIFFSAAEYQRFSEEIVFSEKIMTDLDFQLLLKNSFSNNNLDSTTKPCHLYISYLNENNIGEFENYRDYLSDVATISVTKVEDYALVESLVKIFPKACHFALPNNILNSFKSRFPKISCESSSLDRDVINNLIKFSQDLLPQAEDSSSETSSSDQNLPNKKRSYDRNYLNNSSSKIFNTEDSLNSEIPEIKLAKVLNDESAPNPSIRTQVIQRDIVNGLEQQDYVPSQSAMVDVEIENPILTSEKIEEFKLCSSQEELYYLMGAELKKDQMVRLNSASGDEEFMGYFSKNSEVRIKIQKGDDDFLYATSDQDCAISFVTKVDQREINKFTEINAGENFHIDKIREYLGNPKYKSNADPDQDFPKYDPTHHQEWLQELFDYCLGVCRHRVAAVEYFLKINGIDDQDLRVVGINQNHQILEISHRGKWYPIDLGGGGIDAGSIDKTENLDLPAKKDAEENILSLEDIKFTDWLKDTDLAEVKTKLESLIREKIEPEKVLRSADDLLSNSFNSDKKKILIVTNKNNEAHANFLLSMAAQQRKYFYIDKPSDIDLDSPSLFIDKNGNAAIRKKGRLEQFLSSLEDGEASLLLINWDNFSSQQKVALNSIIDRQRSINGINLPESLQLIGLSEKLSKDASFLSRHDVVVRSNLSQKELLPNLKKIEEDRAPTEIDLAGFSDYRSKLFGRISIEKETLKWHKDESDFVSYLEGGAKNFNIFNLSIEGRENLKYEFEQAKARGYLSYHGYQISFGGDIEISFEAREYDFSAFQNYKITTDVAYSQIENSSNYHIVNSQLFDRLLYGKKIEQELYQEIPGLIESKADQNLELFITSDLSDSQWFCLFKKAADFGVNLDIKVAQKVLLPQGLSCEKLPNDATSLNQNRSRIILTNDASRVEIDAQSTIIDIEDFTYQDFQKIDFRFENGVFDQFKSIESELLNRMRSGSDKVVIRGEFDSELLKMMHPMLLAHGEFEGILKNLTFIVEDKNISSKTSDYQELSFLGEGALKIDYFPQVNTYKNHQNNFTENNKEFDSLGEDSAEKAQSFIERRKSKFHELLQDNSLLKLSGHSGVGKSSLMEEIAKEENVSMYYEMYSFEEFAKDNSTNATKILFIDEANIDDADFTRFSQLKNGGNKEIFYQGKFHQLGENHKIVFAGNDKSYGGGRSEQKLFADGSVPIMHLGDFPTSYIYEDLLKKPFRKISEEELSREKCAEFIASYQDYNAAQDDETKKLTVRELQEQVLQFLLQKNRKGEEDKSIDSKYFVSTKATSAAEKSLRSAINVRKEQYRKGSSEKVLGTSGVLLKGDSGIGKSEMIREIFKQESIEEATLETEIDSDRQYYYRIDSRLPLPQKKAIILKAFREGNMVWMDELNSCIDDGLEKILNAVLTGVDPDNKKPADKPGFIFVATVNEIDVEGRSMLSPAILHRMNYIEMPKLSSYDHEDLTKVIGHFLGKKDPDFFNEKQVQDFAKSFELLRKEYGEYLNFRVFESVLSEYFLRQKEELMDIVSFELPSPSNYPKPESILALSNPFPKNHPLNYQKTN